MAIAGLRRLFQLVVRPFRGRAAVDEEIRFHLEQQTGDLIRAGWTVDVARREAERRFGDAARYREALMAIDRATASRRGRREWLGNFGQDLRLTARLLGRSPGFTVAVVLTLGLGIGANATMFGLVDRLLFKPPAHVVDPDRVGRLVVTETGPSESTPFSNTSVSYPSYQAQRRDAKRVEQVAAFYTGWLAFDRGENARQLRVTLTSAGFFPLLGVTPAFGRFYTEDQDRIGSPPVAVISARLWRREFGQARDVLGKTLFLGRRIYRIIGVAPAGFTGIDLDAVDAWLPLDIGGSDVWGSTDDWRTQDGFQWVNIVTRLSSGADRSAAGAEAAQVYRRIRVQSDPTYDNPNYRVTAAYAPVIAARGAAPSQSAVVAELLAGVSLLVLLIACANVANLFLARGVSRRREIAVRLALGVRRGRLVRMLVMESGVLCLLGAGIALVIAQAGGGAVRRFLLPNIEFAESPVDFRVLVVTLAAMAVTLAIVGLVPAMQVSHPELGSALKLGGGRNGLGGDRRQARLRTGLLLAQATLSVVLLVGAGLFVRSFQRASSLDLGFDPGGVIVAQMDLELADYSHERKHQFFVEARDRLAAYPGVERASLGVSTPFWIRYSKGPISIPGRDSLPRFPGGSPRADAVTPEHFATLGIRIRRGRGFTAQDRAGSAPVVIVNQAMANAYWPGEAAVGRCMKIGGDSTACREVVGVVDDVRFESLIEPTTGRFWVPLEQGAGFPRDRVLFLKTRGDPRALVAGIRRALQSMAPNLPRADVRPLSTHLDPVLQPWRLGATMFGLFGSLALLVSVVGLYSVLAYTVAQRTQEFGVRTALGASGGQVRRLVFRQGVGVVLAGVIAGVGLALVASRWLAPLLFQTSARDPVVFASVTAVLLGAACLASFIPAERASRVDPMEALRAE